MPGWGEILAELQATAQQNNNRPDFDLVRRKYVAALHQKTQRPVILYYTDWLSGRGGSDTTISLLDMQGMMEVCRGLNGPALDILLHSPGGSPEAAASIVRYLRTKFTDIRVFVPLAAMSAATMWALSADRIVMGKHSQLGPIDPQIVNAQGQFPARAIIRQFDQARRECAEDPSRLNAWFPILQQYGPALLQICEGSEALARQLVRTWLADYMLRNQPNQKRKAASIARFFSNYGANNSHSLGIDREVARRRGVVIDDLEAEQALQDAVLSVHHASLLTLEGPAVKLIENHLGRTFAQVRQTVSVQAVPFAQPPTSQPPAKPTT